MSAARGCSWACPGNVERVIDGDYNAYVDAFLACRASAKVSRYLFASSLSWSLCVRGAG